MLVQEKIVVRFFTDGHYDFSDKLWKSDNENIPDSKWVNTHEYRIFPMMLDRIAFVKWWFQNICFVWFFFKNSAISVEPRTAENDLLKDWAVVDATFSGIFPDEYTQKHLTKIQFFSSNSCQFLRTTDLPKTADCPLGHVICERDGVQIFGNQSLYSYDANQFCLNQKAKLSK